MDMDTDLIDAKASLEEADDSCKTDFAEIVPHTGDSCTTECIGGDCFGSEEDLADMKQEPDDVCCILCPIFSLSQQKEFVLVVGNNSVLWS